MRGNEKRSMLPVANLHPDNVALYVFDAESEIYRKQKSMAWIIHGIDILYS